MNAIATVSLAIFLLAGGCGGEVDLAGTAAPASKYEVSGPYIFKNTHSSTCIDSNPLGMAPCNGSATQKLEWVLRPGSRGKKRWWLRFSGTDQCLYANSEKEIKKKKCKTKKDKYFWYSRPSSSPVGEGRYAFTSGHKGRCLKVNDSGKTLKAGGCDGKHLWDLKLNICVDPDAGEQDIFQATSIDTQADECVNLGWFAEGRPAVKEMQCDGANWDVVSTVKECWENPDGSGALTSCYQGACLSIDRVQNRTREDFELLPLVHEPGDDGMCLQYTSIWQEKKGEEVISRTEARNSSPNSCGNVVVVQRILAKAAFTSGSIDANQIRSYMEQRGYVLDPKTGVFLHDDPNGSTWYSASADGRYLYYLSHYDWWGDAQDPLQHYLDRYPPNVINYCPSGQIYLDACGCVSSTPTNCHINVGAKVGVVHSSRHTGLPYTLEACQAEAEQFFRGEGSAWFNSYFACGKSIPAGPIAYQEVVWGKCRYYTNTCP